MPTNTAVHVQLGGAFWVLVMLLVIVGSLLAILGPTRLRSVVEGGFRDAIGTPRSL
jgi:hypothetical protein